MNKKTTLITNSIIIFVFIALIVTGFTSQSNYVFSSNLNQAIYRGNTEKKQVTLMFNVYWGTEYIEPLLDIFKQNNCTTTFFVGGSWADDNNSLLLKMVENGHEIGNHGYFHKNHKTLSYNQNIEEIKANDLLISAITGEKMTLFAPPSGSMGNEMVKACNDLDYDIIMWTKDTIDWRDKDTQLIITRATKNISNGDLILMHPTKNTLEALPQIIKTYQDAGFDIVSVSKNIAQ